MAMSKTSVINPVFSIEMQEVIQKLRANGHGQLLDCLFDESECWTKKGRLNKSATIRFLGWKSKQLEDALQAMKELLKNEYNFDFDFDFGDDSEDDDD